MEGTFKMKVAEYVKAGTFRYRACQDTSPGPGQVKIRVSYCGICGTDMHIFRGHLDARVKAPQSIGHEMSGVIVEIGPEVENLRPGKQVTVMPLDNCAVCLTCQRGYTHICEKLRFLGIDTVGAFAQYWIVPARLVQPLPDDMPLRLAALVEPLAVACHDIRMAELSSGQRVVVNGGGPIGLLIALVARQKGADVRLMEINPARLRLAGELGFVGWHPEQGMKELAQWAPGGADVVFEVSGSAAGALAMTAMARPRGTLVMVAIFAQPVPVDLHKFFWKELRMQGARVYELEDFQRAIDLASSGALPLERLLSREFPLAETQAAFEYLADNPEAMKVLINCQEEQA
jgi:(R,R)-butanediol dehydrogenase/meso-butanediol dehydrogenase/diacetyl reductase